MIRKAGSSEQIKFPAMPGAIQYLAFPHPLDSSWLICGCCAADTSHTHRGEFMRTHIEYGDKLPVDVENPD